MYNRYIRDQQGGFTRIREEDAPAEDSPYSCGPPPPPGPPSFGGADIGFRRRILGKLGMADVDTGDLLLLLILFLLFTEGGSKDEELMIALGLLLIL